jgi:hypothetical protein
MLCLVVNTFIFSLLYLAGTLNIYKYEKIFTPWSHYHARTCSACAGYVDDQTQ